MKKGVPVKPKVVPTSILQVATIGDLVASLDDEIASIKSGTLSEPKARVIAKNRQLQLQSFQLVLAAARIEAKYRPELARRIGGIAEEGK